MARVFFSAPHGAWLFGQKNRSILITGPSELAEIAAAQVGVDRPPLQHAVEVGTAWFRLLDRLPPGGEAAVRAYCSTHALALEKVGSAFQQHLARETEEGGAAELRVFSVCPLDAVAAATAADALPRLPVAAMVADCARLGLPWAGGLPPARLLEEAAGGSGAAPLLPARLAAALHAAAAAGGECPGVVVESAEELDALRAAVLALDDDNLEGVVPVVEAPGGAVLAQFKFKVAIYYVRRRLREQLRGGVTSPQLPALRARLEEWISRVPPWRAEHHRALVRRVHHWGIVRRPSSAEVDAGILALLEACAVPDPGTGCFRMCALCDPASQVLSAVVVALPGAVEDVAAAIRARDGGVSVDAHPEKGAPLKAGDLEAWAVGATGVLVVSVLQLAPAEAVLHAAVALQVLVLVAPPPEGRPDLLASGYAPNARAAAAMLSRGAAALEQLAAAAAVAAPQHGRMHTVVVSSPAEAAAAAVVRCGGARTRPLAARAPAAAPSATRLAVFVVGIPGLGKSALARALCGWVAASSSLTAAEVDQDRFMGSGSGDAARAAARDAMMAALHAHLDAGVGLLICHRNGPGSAPLMGALRVRGVPWVVVFPAELLCAAPEPGAVAGAGASLLARADADAPVLAGLSPAEKVAVLRNFLAALPAAAADIAPLASAAALPLAYFFSAGGGGATAAATAAETVAEGAALRLLLAAAGQSPFSAAAKGAGAEDAALASAVTADGGSGARRRSLEEICLDIGPRLLALASLPDAQRCALGAGGVEESVGEGDTYVAAFLLRGGARAPHPAAAAAYAAGRELHVTLAHAASAPAQLRDVLARGLLGARVRVACTHAVSATWTAGGAGTPARVDALVVARLEVDGSGEDLLPLVASRTPHITLRAEGATANVAAGAAMRLLLAHTRGALPEAPATFAVQGVEFVVEPAPFDALAVVATCSV
jgi:hypothetical protein